MKKRVFAMLCAACLLVALLFSCQTNRKIIMDPQSVADERGDIDVKQDTDEPPDVSDPPDIYEAPIDGDTHDIDESALTNIDNDGDAIRIAFIPMDAIDMYWHAMYDGAQKAANEIGATVTFMGNTLKCEDGYYMKINEAIAGKYQAILLAAIGPTLSPVSNTLSKAIAADVKLIYVDSQAEIPAEASFVTDNRAAGRTAGKQMLEALTANGVSSGNIGIVDVNAITDSVVARNAGFREVFEDSEFTFFETGFCDGDASKAQTIAEEFIDKGVVGIYGTNEGSTVGAGNAIKAYGDGSIIGVGFDKSDAIMGLIDNGWLFCTIAQNPEAMGYEGVKAAIAAIGGESLGGIVVDTGVLVIKKTV